MKSRNILMNREALIIAILILVFVSGVIYFIVHNTNIDEFVKENFSIKKTNENNDQENTPSQDTTTSVSTTTSGDSSVGGSSSGGSSSSSSEGIENSGINLPGDINTQPCGFYSSEYGEVACGGYCEVGTCVTEGRSCYCKE
jgi:hypothetical protein